MEDLLALGVENGKAELHPTKYRVVQTDQTYCGELRVGVNFTAEVFSLFYQLLLTSSKSLYLYENERSDN